MECAENRILGIGAGLFAVILIFTLSLGVLRREAVVAVACGRPIHLHRFARSCRQSSFCLVLLLNVALIGLLVALPKVVQTIGINRQGQFLDIAVAVVIIGALGSTALAANEFLLRSTLAVPRDERLAGWRSSS